MNTTEKISFWETNDLLQAVFNSVPNGIAVMQNVYDETKKVVDFYVLFLNDSTLNWLGNTNYKGKRCSEVFLMENNAGILDHFKNVASTGKTARFEHCYAGNGKTQWFCFTTVKQGDLLVVTTEDLTEQKQAEARWAEAASRFRNMIEESTVAMAVLEGPEWRLTLANNRMLEIWQRDSTIIGKNLLDFLPEMIGQPFPKLLKTVFDTGETYSEEEALVVLKRSGRMEDVYMDFSYKALKNSEGNVYAILVDAADVTERFKGKQQVKESEKRFRTLADNIPMMVFIIEPTEEAKISFWNKTWLNYTGQTLDEALGRAWDEIIHPDDVQTVLKIYIEAFQNRQPYFMPSMRLKRFDGIYRWHQLKGNPRYMPDGAFMGYVGIGLDIHDQKLAEDALRESEERLQAALNASHTGTFRWNIATNDLSWDKNLDQLFGQVQGEVQNLQNFIDKVHPDDRAAIVRACEKCAAEGADFDLEFRAIWPNGTIHWLADKGRTYLDEKGKPAYMTGACIDITAHKESELLLTQSKQRFQAAVHAVQGILWTNNARGEMEGEQAGWSKLTGQTPDDYFGYGWSKALHPDDIQASINAWQAAVESKSTFVYEHRIKKADGNWGIFTIRAIPLLDADGNIQEWVGVHTDITQQRQAENSLRQSEERFRLLSDEMPQFVWTGNASGQLSYFNRAVFEYTGLSEEDVANDGWIQIVHPDDREENLRLWQLSIATGNNFLFEHRFKRADGLYRWQTSRAVPQRDAHGVIHQWIGTSTDIQDWKDLEERLEKLVAERTKELQRSNLDLQHFAHVASHDMKEPVRKVKMFTGRLKQYLDGNLDEQANMFIEKIQSATSRIFKMIDGVLDYSFTNAATLDLVTVDLNEVINNIETDLEVALNDKGAVIDAGRLPVVEGTQILLYQLFYNLISNSIKFTNKEVAPYITIRSQTIVEDNKSFASIRLQDNGIGFDPKHAQKIFEMFTRLNSKDEYEGTGLGLSLCKKIVERHGGNIVAMSTPGKGATFIITFPENKASELID